MASPSRSGVQATVHWLGVLAGIAGLVALVTVQTMAGFAAAIGLLLVALALVGSGARTTPGRRRERGGAT